LRFDVVVVVSAAGGEEEEVVVGLGLGGGKILQIVRRRRGLRWALEEEVGCSGGGAMERMRRWRSG